MSDVTVVDSSNFEQYVDEQTGVPPAPTAEEVAAKEAEAAEASKLADEEEAKRVEEDPTHDVPEVPKDKKSRLNERFSELTAKRKEAEAKAQAEAERATKYESEAKALKEEREKLAKETAELRAKYEPVKEEQDPEPQPSQFNDIEEYRKAIKDWTADSVRREDAKRAAEEHAQNEFDAKMNGYKSRSQEFAKEAADFNEALDSSKVVFQQPILEEILDSELGPQIAYHLAKNQDEAEKIAQMPLSKAIKEIGKLETRLSSTKEENKEETKPKAEISKAPAPISPIRGDASSGSTMIDSKGEFVGSYEDWRRLRNEGKIK
jgi:hypothetical protein